MGWNTFFVKALYFKDSEGYLGNFLCKLKGNQEDVEKLGRNLRFIYLFRSRDKS